MEEKEGKRKKKRRKGRKGQKIKVWWEKNDFAVTIWESFFQIEHVKAFKIDGTICNPVF